MEKNQEKKAMLELRHIKKDYYVDKKPFTAIKDLSVSFPSRGFVAVLGHSGSGKTTLLNIIGGLDHYTDGDLLIDGKSTKSFKDKDWDSYRNKRVGFVFQSYNLIPHMTVLQNVELSLQLGGVSSKERAKKAEEVLVKVGLGEYLKKKPNQLSGGQMQRVAIARALVNDPDIILADEPTGALDSATSVQVMDLIKEVGKDCCVIMVTHNEELAKEYADRIISMKDGEIIHDSAPLEPDISGVEEKEVGKKTSMSFVTALRSSFQNVLTKKGRTILTAVASSFGIIGVALVLATNNGFSNYIANVESSIASSIPISITPVSTRISASTEDDVKMYPTDPTLTVYNPSTSMTTVVYNDFSQEYFDYIDRITNDPTCPVYGKAMSVLYNRNDLNFHFMTEDGNSGKIRTINQYQSAGMLGSAISSVTALPTTIMHELIGDKTGLASMYDTIYGKFPENENELAIILTASNRIDFSTMKNLGFYRSDSNFESERLDKHLTFNFDDILYNGEGDTTYRTFRCFTNSDYYKLPQNPADLDAMVKEYEVDSYTDLSVSYSKDSSGKAVATVNGTPGKRTVKYIDGPGNINDIYNDTTRHPIDCKIVGVLRPTETSPLSLMPPSLAYTPKLGKKMAADYADGTSTHKLGMLQRDNWVIPVDSDLEKDGKAIIQKFVDTLLASFDGKEGTDIDNATLANLSSMITNQLPKAFRSYVVTNKDYVYTSIGAYLGACRNLGATFPKIDLENFMADLMSGTITIDAAFQPGENSIMNLVAAANSYGLVTSILIFPSSLTTKDAVKEYLNDWNKTHPDNEINYSDIMSDLTESLGTMINVISAVLIVFASISLVVSSVMTAIITYVSVIERTKEIGVLRACGGRKKDVGRLFEAECVIVGFTAGVIGVAFTLVACIPINLILDHLFPGNGLNSIASLHPAAAIILVVLSIGLSFVSGLIPSRIAAKKDPVTCLRTE
ncbi:MAG: ABC transporter ATP-binding protein/permease [Bacilli bacterium]|nr:ABC transporter ATP-binding protein/permease [Bacilli bacterium]